MVTPRSLGGVMISTLGQNVRDVGLIPALGTIFPIFITAMPLGAVTMILCAVWLLNLPCVCYIYIYIRSLPVGILIASIKRLTIPGG